MAHPAQLTVDASDLGLLVELHEPEHMHVRLSRELGRGRLHRLLHRADEEPDVRLRERRRRRIADRLEALESSVRVLLRFVDVAEPAPRAGDAQTHRE